MIREFIPVNLNNNNVRKYISRPNYIHVKTPEEWNKIWEIIDVGLSLNSISNSNYRGVNVSKKGSGTRFNTVSIKI